MEGCLDDGTGFDVDLATGLEEGGGEGFQEEGGAVGGLGGVTCGVRDEGRGEVGVDLEAEFGREGEEGEGGCGCGVAHCRGRLMEGSEGVLCER